MRTAAGGAAPDGAGGEHGPRLAGLILAESQRAGLGPGSRLPTERRLALDLGVTRSSVRHALALLEAQGRISREVGRGTFLREPAPGGPGGLGGAAPGLEAPGGPPAWGGDFAPADVMMVRRLLEPPAMPLVVAWATAADLDEMDRCLAGGDHAASYEEFESWDLALHRCIMRASRSPLLAALYGVIEQARHGHVWGDLKRRSASAEHRQEYQADHREIVAALRVRDSAAAVEAMRVHLARVSNHLHATDPAAAVTWQ
jgi:DNA-binding FadR family transcriptional regulator